MDHLLPKDAPELGKAEEESTEAPEETVITKVEDEEAEESNRVDTKPATPGSDAPSVIPV